MCLEARTMMPAAVQTCHCMTRAPRILAGEHSAAYTGTVADFARDQSKYFFHDG
jgi:hypothetical protein